MYRVSAVELIHTCTHGTTKNMMKRLYLVPMRKLIFYGHMEMLKFYLRTMKCPEQDRKLYSEFLKMNNSYDKKLIIRFGWYEKDGTDGRKYIEEDGETGLI